MGLGKTKKDPLAPLFKYLDDKLAERAEHRAKFRKIFDADNDLGEAIEGVQAKIKEKLAAMYRGSEGKAEVFCGRNVAVEVTPKSERTIDIDGLIKNLRPVLEEIGALVKVPATKAHETVDKKVLDKAVYEKRLDRAIVEPYYSKGAAMTPSVSFKAPQPAKDGK